MSEVTTRPATGATKAPAKQKAVTLNAQPEASSASPTLIVLTLRPNGDKFNGNRIELAQASGFDRLTNMPNLIGFESSDTGDEIARFVVNKGDEAVGTLREIQLHVDPATCALHWKVGTMLIERLQRYATLLGAHIADGLGRPMDDALLAEIGDHINDSVEARLAEDRMNRTVELPNGERRLLSELSFVYDVQREAGSRRKSYRTVFFDAPAMHFYEGRATGMRMAGELVAFYRKHQNQRPMLVQILEEAFEQGRGKRASLDDAGVEHVASGFLQVIETLVKIGARHLNPEWLEYQISDQLENHERWAAEHSARKAALVEQLRKGREAAKAKRLESSRAAQQKGSKA